MMAREVAWYQKLGCDQDPFSPNPAVDRFYFETPALASHLNTLTSVASKGEFIGLVKGERGIGKTTLLNQMARRFRDDPDVAFTRVTCTEGCSLIQSLGISSGLTEEELAVEPRKVLIEHLTRLRTGGQKVVAAIDDAHLLSPQDLAMLIRIGLSPNASGLVHTVLFAEADIEARLWLSAINDPLPLDRLYTLILTPLASEQTQAYLGHRLAAVGLDRVSFSGAEAAAIQRRSEGIPAAINEQASQRLARRYGPMLGRSLGAVQHIRPTWVAAVTGIAVVAGLTFWQRDALTEWASSVNLSLPFSEDITGTEVAIAIPGQPVESDSSLSSSTDPINTPALESDPTTPSTTATQATLAAVEAIDPPTVPADSSTPSLQNDAQVPSPPSTQSPTATDVIAPVPPESLALPEELQERMREREREQTAATETPEVPPADPGPATLDTPPSLAAFPRLASLGTNPRELAALLGAPVTPETPSTPITGRPKATAADTPAPATEPSTSVDSASESVVNVPDSTPEMPPVNGQDAVESSTTVSQQVPRPRPKPTPPPIQQVATASVPDTTPSPENTQVAATEGLQSRGADWFRQQAPNDYVIQLMVASEEAKLRSYIATQSFPTIPAYFRRARGSYVLVVGPYANEQEARQDISRLPADVQRDGPWIRRIASVQQELP